MKHFYFYLATFIVALGFSTTMKAQIPGTEYFIMNVAEAKSYKNAGSLLSAPLSSATALVTSPWRINGTLGEKNRQVWVYESGGYLKNKTTDEYIYFDGTIWTTNATSKTVITVTVSGSGVTLGDGTNYIGADNATSVVGVIIYKASNNTTNNVWKLIETTTYLNSVPKLSDATNTYWYRIESVSITGSSVVANGTKDMALITNDDNANNQLWKFTKSSSAQPMGSTSGNATEFSINIENKSYPGIYLQRTNTAPSATQGTSILRQLSDDNLFIIPAGQSDAKGLTNYIVGSTTVITASGVSGAKAFDDATYSTSSQFKLVFVKTETTEQPQTVALPSVGDYYIMNTAPMTTSAFFNSGMLLSESESNALNTSPWKINGTRDDKNHQIWTVNADGTISNKSTGNKLYFNTGNWSTNATGSVITAVKPKPTSIPDLVGIASGTTNYISAAIPTSTSSLIGSITNSTMPTMASDNWKFVPAATYETGFPTLSDATNLYWYKIKSLANPDQVVNALDVTIDTPAFMLTAVNATTSTDDVLWNFTPSEIDNSNTPAIFAFSIKNKGSEQYMTWVNGATSSFSTGNAPLSSNKSNSYTSLLLQRISDGNAFIIRGQNSNGKGFQYVSESIIGCGTGVTAAKTLDAIESHFSLDFVKTTVSPGTGVKSVQSAGAVVGIRYYNLQGVEISGNVKGIVIAKITYEDGSVSTSKVIK